MNVVVCVKEAVDLDQIRINDSTREPMLVGLPLEIEDLSKNATEAAIRLRNESGGKVIAVSLGAPSLRKTIKEVLAMGADEAQLLIDGVFEDLDEQGVARILAKAIERQAYFDLVLLGEGSADNYSGIIGPKLSELLGIPGVTAVRELTIESGIARCVRDLEESYMVVETPLPAVITVTNEINEPHLPSLTDILKASKKPVVELGPKDLGLEEMPKAVLRRVRNLAPPMTRKNIRLEGEVGELVEELKETLLREGVIT